MSAADRNSTLGVFSFYTYHRHTCFDLPNVHDDALIIIREILVTDVICVFILIIIVTRPKVFI